MTQFVEQLRNQAKWYAQPGHNARDLMDSRLLEKAADEIDALRAKITEMEQQEPVTWMQSTHLSSFKNRLCGSQSSYVHCSDHQLHPDFKPLYALPGAQKVPSVPDGWKLVPIVSTHKMDMAGSDHCDGYLSTAQAVWDAMLAAAPEAKP